MQHDVDQRVDLPDAVARRLRLRPADVGLPVDDLALQVRLVDGVVVDDPEGADAGRGEVHEGRRAQATGTDAQDRAAFSRFCPAIATSGMIRCRLYRRTSSTESSAAGSTSGGRVMGTSLACGDSMGSQALTMRAARSRRRRRQRPDASWPATRTRDTGVTKVATPR